MSETSGALQQDFFSLVVIAGGLVKHVSRICVCDTLRGSASHVFDECRDRDLSRRDERRAGLLTSFLPLCDLRCTLNNLTEIFLWPIPNDGLSMHI